MGDYDIYGIIEIEGEDFVKIKKMIRDSDEKNKEYSKEVIDYFKKLGIDVYDIEINNGSRWKELENKAIIGTCDFEEKLDKWFYGEIIDFEKLPKYIKKLLKVNGSLENDK